MLFGAGRKSKGEEAMVITLLVACKGSLDIPGKVRGAGREMPLPPPCSFVVGRGGAVSAVE